MTTSDFCATSFDDAQAVAPFPVTSGRGLRL